MALRHKTMIWLAIAGLHFLTSRIIIAATLALTEPAAGAPDGPATAVILLVRLTKLLHFPLITLALYPREWFPGNWIAVPMALNSAIWSCGICWLMAFFRRTSRGRKG
jgi:hypothetical protein